MTEPERGIVLGGSWAGMLTARMLSRHMRHVTVVERDVFPAEPRVRKGTPQARHSHILWSGGARIVEEFLPGTLDRLADAGARRIVFQRDAVTLGPHGWQHRFPSQQFGIMCGRALLDWVVREETLSTGSIDVRQHTEAVQLLGEPERITGVRVRDTTSGAETTLRADLVVDATGRGSRLPNWLADLGLPPLEEDVVDAGMAYCSRLYQAPPGATDGFPPVNVAADPHSGEPGRFGAVYPQEGGRWIVTLAGTRGAKLPSREADFVPYARTLRDPLVADLIEGAEPLSDVMVSRFGANRRLYPERLDAWPEGLLVLGDALAVFNPIYGHGMSAAARGVAALDEQLAKPGPHPAREAQRAISERVDDPWIMAASKDIEYVDCHVRVTDPRLTGGAADRHQFSAFIDTRALRSPAVSAVMTDVASLSVSPAELSTSRFLALMSRDELRPELAAPPLSAKELALVNLGARAPAATAAAPGGLAATAGSVSSARPVSEEGHPS
ncbi:NAD(P)/FAD-dependent oxidoreductase [Streptomyces smyrnaeus]|uniref:NAD(P)/FAD-dependent oxidoreductase n=1 Tax=Streptomyces smyrnaeus TaxID=1387713 RepID=UPI001B565256|nr:FAD-dependent monooxygenase [Streptomyces sp. A73]